MPTASFLALSLALHAAALVFPVALSRQTQLELMRVTIMPMEEGATGAGKLGSGGPAPWAGPTAAPRTPPSVDSKANASSRLDPTRWRTNSRPATALGAREEPNPEDKVELKASRDSELKVVAAEMAGKIDASNATPASAIAVPAQTHSAGESGPASNHIYAAGPAMEGISMGGNGAGPSARSGSAGGLGASGTGAGPGNGQGSSGKGLALTQARYRDTPKPNYPESARREGREGRVLLRVLVDDQGRLKQVEINSSSGSYALDRAAAEAIRHWRFYPARNGDQPVESWLRIPIEFRLADAKSH